MKLDCVGTNVTLTSFLVNVSLSIKYIHQFCYDIYSNFQVQFFLVLAQASLGVGFLHNFSMYHLASHNIFMCQRDGFPVNSVFKRSPGILKQIMDFFPFSNSCLLFVVYMYEKLQWFLVTKYKLNQNWILHDVVKGNAIYRKKYKGGITMILCYCD